MDDPSATELIEPLSATEARVLANQEDLIGAGLGTFVVVGKALMQIRDERLYRQNYATFEDYCRERWGLARRSAYQYIEAAAVVDDVRQGAQMLPENERQARALVTVPREQRAELWAKAVQTAPDGKMTAQHVAAVVEQSKQPMTEPSPAIFTCSEESVPPEADSEESDEHLVASSDTLSSPLFDMAEVAEAQTAPETLADERPSMTRPDIRAVPSRATSQPVPIRTNEPTVLTGDGRKAALRYNWADVTGKIDENLPRLEPEELRGAFSETQLRLASATIDRWRAWIEKWDKAAQPGLRLMSKG